MKSLFCLSCCEMRGFQKKIYILENCCAYFIVSFDGSSEQYVILPRDVREKGRDLTQSYAKSHYTHRKIQKKCRTGKFSNRYMLLN